MEQSVTVTKPQLPTTTFDHSKVAAVKLNSDELFFVNNDKEYTIKQYETLKLSDNVSGYKGAELARYNIGKALEQMYELVGLKKENYPSRDLGRSLAKYIQDTFPFINPYEIVTAVEFGLQGKYNNLNSDGKSIFEHYGTMDLPYVNTFMQAYVRFRYEKKIAITDKVDKAQLPTAEQVIENLINDDKAVKSLLQEAFDQYKAFPNDKVSWLRDPWFYWLVDIGLIKYDRVRLIERFNQIKSVRFDLTSTECKHLVCVENMYELFQRIKDDPEPFKIFNDVTYLSDDTHAKLHYIKRKQS